MRTGEGGQSTVELALCLPILVLLLAAVIQVGAVALDRVRLWHAAREAARVASVDSDPEQIERAATKAGPNPVRVTVEPDEMDRRPGDPVSVTLEHESDGIVPILGRLFSIPLEARAVMRIEQP